MGSYYQSLGIHRAVSNEEVKAAWQKLSRELHPDVHAAEQTSEEQEMQSKLFAELTEAYSVLRDPKSRVAYDRRLAVLGDKCDKCGGHGFTTKTKGFTKREAIPCQVCAATGRILRGGAK